MSALLFCALGGCTETDKSCDTMDEVYEIENVTLSMAESTGVVQTASTRAVSGFVVNTADDPTYPLTEKEEWILDLTIYKGNTPYLDGNGKFEWNGSYRTTFPIIYMPNYLMQEVEATLYPLSWAYPNGTIQTDQSDVDNFLEQDVLVQNGSPTYETAPAHYLYIEMRHAHSMVDFVLADVNPQDIESVTVEADGLTYLPYKADISAREEYLVILPTGIAYPTIYVTTKEGAKYSKELDIDATLINTCYYVRLVGLELTLEALAVTNWTYGEAVAGDYSSVTSYPTFRGPENTTLTIYYDNGLEQDISFNDLGEVTVKPSGRTIVKISSGALSYTFSPPLSIREMVIDLNEYIDQMS